MVLIYVCMYNLLYARLSKDLESSQCSAEYNYYIQHTSAILYMSISHFNQSIMVLANFVIKLEF